MKLYHSIARKFLLASVIVLSAVMVAPAHAKGLYVAPVLGAYLGESNVFGTTIEYEAAPLYGLGLGYEFTEQFALDFSYTKVTSDIAGHAGSSISGCTELDITALELSGVATFPNNTAPSSFLLRSGIARVDPEFLCANGNLEQPQETNPILGFGWQVSANRVFFRAEANRYFRNEEYNDIDTLRFTFGFRINGSH